MPGVNDWTIDPLKVVERIFEECGADGPWRERIKQHFQHEMKQPSVLEKLPWVNESPLHHLRSGQLVRFRGMVQDMLGKEFFSDVYEVVPEGGGAGDAKLVPGRYKDVVQCGVGETIDANGPRSETGDRLVYYCIPVPGETDWVKQVYRDTNPYLPPAASTSSGQARHKRPATDDQVESMETEEEGEGEERKRVRGERWGEATAATPSSSSTTTTTTTTTSTPSPSTPESTFPLPGMKGTPALVKVYEEEGYTLNQIIEVVAVLSVNPALSSPPSPANPLDPWQAGEAGEEGGHSASPSSLVPRLHAITARPMQHTNPLLTSPSPSPCMKEARGVLEGVLGEVCLGDEVAAQHLLCHLLSSVYGRQDVTVLGKYCINLTGVDAGLQRQGYSLFLYETLARLVTQAHYLPLTLANINKGVFVPKKNYQTDSLTSGILQLPAHTHLVLDETSLSEGQVDGTGVGNLAALGTVITWQKVDYDFQYHTIEQLTNLPVLVMSEGKSMLPSDVQVKLQARQRDVEAARGRVEEILSSASSTSQIRSFLTSARLASYVLTDDMQKVVQDDFLNSRKTATGEALSATDLHRLLVLARLLTLSYGETQLDRDLWEKAKVIENGRKARLPLPSSSSSSSSSSPFSSSS